MTSTPRRFPSDVFSQGSDPDARFSLANERTYLAWTRTSLALVAGAVAVHTPYLQIDPWMRFGLSIWLLTLACSCVLQGYLRWRHVETALRTGSAMPGFGGALVLGIGTLGLAAAVIAGSLTQLLSNL